MIPKYFCWPDINPTPLSPDEVNHDSGFPSNKGLTSSPWMCVEMGGLDTWMGWCFTLEADTPKSVGSLYVHPFQSFLATGRHLSGFLLGSRSS